MSTAVTALLRNGAALFLAYVVPRALLFVAMLVAARTLGRADFGAWGTAAATAVLLSIVSTLGIQPLLVRELARSPSRSRVLLRAAGLLKLGTGALMFVLLVGVLFLLDPPRAVTITTAVLCIGYAIGSWSENLGAWFQSQERMHVWTHAATAFGLVAGVGGAIAVASTGSIIALAVMFALGHAVALTLLVVRARGDGVADTRFGVRHALRSLVREAMPFALTYLALTAYSKLDVLLLAQLRSAEDVGLYTAAYKFVDMTQALVIVGAAALLPRLARAPGADAARGRGRTVELATLAVAPFAGVLFLLREPIVLILFGGAFAPAATATAFLAVLLPFLALNITAGYVLGVAGAMQAAARAYGLALVIKTALGLLLIPRYGATGAAGAALLGELALTPMLVAALAAVGVRPRPAMSLVFAGVMAIVAALSVLPDVTGGIVPAAVVLLAAALLYSRAEVLTRGEVLALREALVLRLRPRRTGDTATDGAL